MPHNDMPSPFDNLKSICTIQAPKSDSEASIALTQALTEGVERGGFPLAHWAANADVDAAVWHRDHSI